VCFRLRSGARKIAGRRPSNFSSSPRFESQSNLSSTVGYAARDPRKTERIRASAAFAVASAMTAQIRSANSTKAPVATLQKLKLGFYHAVSRV
jgi:hypothetical protein